MSSVQPSYILLEEWSEDLEEITQGRLRIKPYPGGAIVGMLDEYDAVSTGTIEMAVGSSNFWAGKNPGWALMSDIPFGTGTVEPEEELMMWFFFDDGIRIANEMANPDGILWRPAFFNGMQTGWWSREPIRTLEDMKGKKMRIGGGPHMEVLKRHGVATVAMGGGETYEALERGVIDMAEWFTPGADLPMKFHEVVDYLLVPQWAQPNGPLDFLINMNAYNELPAELQATLEMAMREYCARATFECKYNNIQALKEFENLGITIFRLPEEDMATLRQDSREVVEEWAAETPLRQEIWESRKKFAEDYEWYQEQMKLGGLG